MEGASVAEAIGIINSLHSNYSLNLLKILNLNCLILESKIKEGISEIEHFSLEDQSDGCGAKFLCIIVSSEFNDMKLLDRQRKVNDILG